MVKGRVLGEGCPRREGVGGWYRPTYRGVWYAGWPVVGAAAIGTAAAVGAAATAPYYYPPACGYYPYPPC
jgi:hypothetical protein